MHILILIAADAVCKLKSWELISSHASANFIIKTSINQHETQTKAALNIFHPLTIFLRMRTHQEWHGLRCVLFSRRVTLLCISLEKQSS